MKSLATRYLRAYDTLADAQELNEIYHSDFMAFAENLLVDLYGFKKEEPKTETHRPRKIGSRPPKRKIGERPPRIGELIDRKEAQIAKYEENNEQVRLSSTSQKPEWYKKAWRKVMMQVHPDRIDLVSKDDIDKLERLKIGVRLRKDDSSELLVACCNELSLTIDLNEFEQERMLRVSVVKFKNKTKEIQESVPWLWSESILDNNVRVQLMKRVLQNSGYNVPDDVILTEYIVKKIMQ